MASLHDIFRCNSAASARPPGTPCPCKPGTRGRTFHGLPPWKLETGQFNENFRRFPGWTYLSSFRSLLDMLCVGTEEMCSAATELRAITVATTTRATPRSWSVRILDRSDLLRNENRTFTLPKRTKTQTTTSKTVPPHPSTRGPNQLAPLPILATLRTVSPPPTEHKHKIRYFPPPESKVFAP